MPIRGEDSEVHQTKGTLYLMHLSDQVTESRLFQRHTLNLRKNKRRDIQGDSGGILFRCRDQHPVDCRL